ncbi:MAG: acyl-CoA dehydrogenase family protein [Flavobacteriales bacterium]|nr:acyl-CoA dehydrogenase family protein [Flavobacteriales bacterium]
MTKTFLKGGEFLIKDELAINTYIPEEFTEEQVMFSEMAEDFLRTKVWPNIEKIDKCEDPNLMINLLSEAGELGLLGAGVPESYGGLGVDFNTETILAEHLGPSHSFGVAVAAHSGIGTLPILYFGTEEQKQKYLPDLATGKTKAAYCLTEPGSGSDALAAKTKAVLSEDGKHYIINGQKMWITNGGFADILTVFAKIDGEQFTGFIVEANTPGVTLGKEEKKMGIKGSSTCQIFFDNVKIPVENLLGEAGKGHKIAFNVLNIGRFKLCAMVTGGAKEATSVAVKYANERKQFGVPISSFGAIKYKIAEMAIRTFASESATYRTSSMIRNKIADLVDEGKDRVMAKLEAAEEYSIECAILKVLGSEVLDYVSDEAVQIFGGTGYSEDYPVARFYRDSRINRIFEGTNEINRILTVAMMLKRTMKGQLDLMTPALEIQKELTSIPDFGDEPEGYLAPEKKALAQAKKAILMVAGAAVQKFMMEFEKEQEIMMNLADMLIDLYAAESTILRVEKLNSIKPEKAQLFENIAKCYLNDSLERIHLNGKHAITAFSEGDELRMMLLGLKRFTKYNAINTTAIRREVADSIIEAGGYNM